MSRTIWGLHMSTEHETVPVDQGYVTIGWHHMGDLSTLPADREAFKQRFREAYDDAKAGAIPVQAGVLYRFAYEMQQGDYVIYPSKIDRMVHIGQITSDYQYLPNAPYDCPNRREVKWLAHVPRTDFSQSALHEIGSALTLFTVTSHAEEFMAALAGEATGANDVDDESVEEVSTQVEESTEDFIIKRLKSKLTPYEFEKFVAHLLTRMGFFARVTSQSADGGIDIIAHKDELGFEPPIIKVQCKQTLESVGRPKVQELHGAIEQGEHGLFVTLGTYTSDARTFERGKPNLRLIDGPGLVDLIYNHYERFEPRYQMLLPLKRTYIPGPSISSAD
ncbi:restriction endonuclease [Thalassospira marina]|uniref:Restriction endonuclease n=1 Tax=Thalassospira marina TaxID=2048283 RepID=A0A2N3KU69_9PROT|nr:restriction endonuclease [Thalassospira marina]PKR54050.1 restriction endonuclease [Thalassospira marina]